ncbi:MAG: phosphate propanoyltransferase [Patescibacteria group bacterium]
MKNIQILVEVSARHVHLSQNDLEMLFGSGYKLKKKKDLTQPSNFAAEEIVNIKINSQVLESIRIVGPVRENTQIEISKTDSVKLGANPPIRLSGDIEGSSAVAIVGPKGEVNLEKGLIVAQRHIHCATNEAKKLKLKNGAEVSVKIDSERPVTFHNVKVRVRDDYKLCLHLDTDEGNAAGINKIGGGLIV